MLVICIKIGPMSPGPKRMAKFNHTFIHFCLCNWHLTLDLSKMLRPGMKYPTWTFPYMETWAHRQAFQLNSHELPLIAAFLMVKNPFIVPSGTAALHCSLWYISCPLNKPVERHNSLVWSTQGWRPIPMYNDEVLPFLYMACFRDLALEKKDMMHVLPWTSVLKVSCFVGHYRPARLQHLMDCFCASLKNTGSFQATHEIGESFNRSKLLAFSSPLRSLRCATSMESLRHTSLFFSFNTFWRPTVSPSLIHPVVKKGCLQNLCLVLGFGPA